MILKYEVIDNQYTTLRQVLKNKWHISSRLLVKLKKENAIFVNDENVYIDYPLNVGYTIIVKMDFKERSENIVETPMELNIIYEDEYYIVINKPANMPVHPSSSHYTDSLANGLQYYYRQNNIQTKIRPVNRLDKDTSGVVIFAKNEYIQESLISQMKTKVFEKTYIALLEGNLEITSGTINAPIARKENSIIERCVHEQGDIAITHYKLIENKYNYCIVEFRLETGRTHQIRLHSQYISHPILGDTLYGTASKLINRQALHSYKVKFMHPILEQEVEHVATIPNDISKCM